MWDRILSPRARRRWMAAALAVLLLGGIAGRRSLAHIASARTYVIPTASMLPTLRPGDRLEADDAGGADPRRGELWIVRGPARLFPGGGPLVKRVVGLPGETIAVANGTVLIDGRPLAEPYLAAPPAYTMPPRPLGLDEYFVLGDNRNASNDSHLWGPAPRRSFLGRARLRFWPPARLGGL